MGSTLGIIRMCETVMRPPPPRPCTHLLGCDVSRSCLPGRPSSLLPLSLSAARALSPGNCPESLRLLRREACAPCRRKSIAQLQICLSAGKTARRGGMGDAECSPIQTFCEQMCSRWMTHGDRGRLKGALGAHLESRWKCQTLVMNPSGQLM